MTRRTSSLEPNAFGFHNHRQSSRSVFPYSTMIVGLVYMKFRAFLSRFRNEESGQDLAEYCLLTALLTLIAAGIFVQASGGVQAIWNGANLSLTAGNGSSSTQTGGSAPASTQATH
jgi:Flp pilus assembly pilin Flp